MPKRDNNAPPESDSGGAFLLGADFEAPEQTIYKASARAQAGKKQLLGRAIGLHKRPGLSVLDCTGGLGTDCLTLVLIGATVTVCERNPDLIERFEELIQEFSLSHPELSANLNFSAGDSSAFVGSTQQEFDVLYIDPMFPDQNKTAKAKKNLQNLRDALGHDEDAHELLQPARQLAKSRVVVKRGAKAPWLADEKPHLSLTGNSVRYDVYLPLS